MSEDRKRVETIAPDMPLEEADKLPFFRREKLKPGDADEALRESRRDRLASAFQ